MKYPPGIWNAMSAAACQASGWVWVAVGYGRTTTVRPAGSQRVLALKKDGILLAGVTA